MMRNGCLLYTYYLLNTIFSPFYSSLYQMNRILILSLVVISSLFFAQKASAQFDVHFTQYWDLNGYYNPAWAGQTDKLNIYGTYSMQLTNFDRAPRTMNFGADMPFSLFNKRQGVGVGVMSDAIGLFKNQRFWLQYSYKLKIKGGTLGIGVQGGIINVAFDPKDLDLGPGGESDPAFPSSKQSGTGIDLGIGAFYSHSKFYVGFSGQHLTSPILSFSKNDTGETSQINIKPMLYFTGGYNIQTSNPLISIQPSTLVQSDLNSTRVDLTGRFFYTFEEKKLALGLTYSPSISFTFSIGAVIRSVTVGYAYEMYTSQIGVGNGSHDLVVSYAMDINLFKKSKNKHKSIRIL